MKYHVFLIQVRQGRSIRFILIIKYFSKRKGQQRLERFQMVYKQQACMTFIEFDGNCCDVIVQNLLDNNKINQWNPYVSQSESMVIKELLEDKSFQICEILQMTNLFVFKREYQYLGHYLKIDNIEFIVQKQIDQRPKTKCNQGSLKYCLWSIEYKNNVTKVCYVTEQSVFSLSYPDEDSYLTQVFLQQINNINKSYILKLQNKIKFLLLKVMISEQQIQIGQSQIQTDQQCSQIKVIKENQQQNQEENDQFFDCEEEDAIDEMNDNLYIVETVANKQLVQEDVVKDVYEQNARRESILPIQIDTQDNTEQDWVEKKRKLVLSGGYCSLSINVKHQLKPKEKGQQIQFLITQEGGHYIFKRDFIREEKNGGLKVLMKRNQLLKRLLLNFQLPELEHHCQWENLLLVYRCQYQFLKLVQILKEFVVVWDLHQQTQMMLLNPKIFIIKSNNVQHFILDLHLCIFLVRNLSIQSEVRISKDFMIIVQFIMNRLAIILLYVQFKCMEDHIKLMGNQNQWLIFIQIQLLVEMLESQRIIINICSRQLNGTTYGDKVLNYLEKQFIIDLKNKIILETTFNPDKKYCQYFEFEDVNQLDYLCGAIYDVTDAAIMRYQKESHRKYKGLDLKNDIKQVRHKIKGIWINELKVDNQKLISIQNDYPVKMQLAQFPISSDATFRMDLLWWKLRNFDESQQWKEKLEIIQRQDRKLREQKTKKKK